MRCLKFLPNLMLCLSLSPFRTRHSMFPHFLFIYPLFISVYTDNSTFIDNSTIIDSFNTTLSEDVIRLRDAVPSPSLPSPLIYPQASERQRRYLIEIRRLYTDVMKMYEKDLSPAYSKYDEENAPPPMVVNLTVESVILLSVNENEQILNIIMDLVIDWYDERLSWNPSQYSDIQSMFIRRKELWMPDVAPYECQSMDELRPEETRIVQVNSDGKAEYRFTLVLGCVCTLELDDYPFDIQHCHTQFYIYQHKPEAMVVRGQMRMNDNFLGNDVWEFRNVSTTKGPMMYDSPLFGPTLMNMAEFNYSIARNYLFYLVFIVSPTSLLSIISLLAMFHEKIDKNNKLGKIGIGIGVLTAMTLILTIVADSVPRKKSISVLATFIIANIFLIAFATFVVVINPSRIFVRLLRRCFPKEHAKPISILLETEQPPRNPSNNLGNQCINLLIRFINSNLLLLLLFETASIGLLGYIIESWVNPNE